jgi:dolichol-phosphate mannosyltransferase
MIDKRGGVSIVIPLYNEEKSLPLLIDELNRSLASEKDIDFEVIFVDDGSEDRSFEVLKESTISGYTAKLVKLSRNYGSHLALRAGIFYATHDIVTFKYADLQETVQTILDLYHKLSEGFDIVWGLRKYTNLNFVQRMSSLAFAFLIKTFVMPNFPKKGVDLVIFNKKVKDLLNKNIEKNSSVFLQILSFGLKQGFCYYKKGERAFGKSRWTLSKKIKLTIDVIANFSYKPIRFISMLGIILSFVGFLWLSYVVYRKLFIGDLSVGWATLNGILLIGFGVTNISLGIIAEYLWRTLDATRRRPPFIVEELIEDRGRGGDS